VAEGILGGLVGGEDEGSAPEAGVEAKLSAEAFAAAVAADHAKYDPGVARATQAFLERQASLLKSQDEQLNAESDLRLSHLRSQSLEGRIRRVGQRVRVGMQIFVAVIAAIIGLGLLVMLYDAFTSRSVVVNAFKAPSTLAGRGLTGDVVASGVLDGLQKLQSATRTPTKILNTTSAWASDVKIDVPETGVSIGEIGRLLHQRFGHDVHIDGDLIQTQTGGLTLTVRGDGVPAKSFTGGADDLDKLSTQAAEYIYGRSQPIEYATYLQDANRMADEVAFIQEAYLRATTEMERATLAKYLADGYAGLNEPARSVEQYRLVMTSLPRHSSLWWRAWADLLPELPFTNGEEAAWRESRTFMSEADAASKKDRPPLYDFGAPAALTWDLPLDLRANLSDAERTGGAGASSFSAGPVLADIYALMHDPEQEARAISRSDPNDYLTKAQVPLLQGYAALDKGDAADAIAPLEAFAKIWRTDPNLKNYYIDGLCYLGLAYGLNGSSAKAEAVFTEAGPWSLCYAFHGDVLAHAGDVAGAQRTWSEGLRLAPDLPTIYLHRGQFELNHGDLKGAEADFSTASAKAPRFGDPLKAWGDVLTREGQWKLALAKYDEALKYAPAWTQLHQARDAAAAHGR
jgi:tetratricopeptide (TPR) repeat protein